MIRDIQEQVGDGSVLCAMSGGVDSAVTAALVRKAVGDRLTCVFVDTGLMRKNEHVQVPSTFRQCQPDIDLIELDAQKQFLQILSGIVDPEKKRRRIGHLFIRLFEAKAREIGATFFAQGTNRADVEMSSAQVQHNVAGLPEHFGFTLVEPLRGLYKDEIRQLARELGLPDEIVNRQPFPGPGLAIRIVGEVTAERLDIVREADHIFLSELKDHEEPVSQAFAVLLPEVNTIVLRAVLTVQFMDAAASYLSVIFLRKVARKIVDQVPGINRVVYDVTDKPPATIEWQ